MFDPSSLKFQKVQNLQRTGAMYGADRPVGRVTWANQDLHAVKASHPGTGYVRYLDRGAAEIELFTIRTIAINRSIGTDAGSCTITLTNDDTSTSQPEGVDTAGRRGYLTPGRGETRATTTSIFQSVQTQNLDIGEPATHITYPTTWRYPRNQNRDALIPNSVLRTYQGYGSDNMTPVGQMRPPDDDDYVAPADDAQLFLTGLWLIDQADFGADGTITVQCRDAGKLLIEQYIYPPMIPIERFPLIYTPAQAASGHKESIGADVATFHSSSVDAKYGHNHVMRGHRGSDAFDHKFNTFWESGADSAGNRMEWLQAKVHGDINEIRMQTPGGNYVVWICVHANGKWQGTSHVTGTAEDGNNRENLTHYEGNGTDGYLIHTVVHGDTLWDLAGTYYGQNTLWPVIARANSNIVKDPHWIFPGQNLKIPYVAGTLNPPPAPSFLGSTGGTHVDIPYVKKASIPKGYTLTTISLGQTFHNADYVRVVFSNLTHDWDGAYRARCNQLTVRNHVTNTYKPSTIGKPGYIQDWYEPVKEMCAWAGLTWVSPPSPDNVPDPLLGYAVLSDEQRKWIEETVPDSYLPLPSKVPLRLWGDFEFLGAGPIVSTPGDYFMSKSFMEGIRLIADFIGAVFFIDESGGAQFRLPNIWTGGNFVADPNANASLSAYIKDHPIEFHEDANLVSYTMTINDDAVRSEILVIGAYPSVHATGPIAGGYVLGRNPATGQKSAIDFTDVLSGQYRIMIVPGDNSKLFFTEAECQRMAELTGLFIMFSYRTGTLTAPAHPGLQLDDQIRIFERVTSESYIHYVSSISTTQNLESGQYTMDVTTHWLGDNPDNQWFTNKAQLTPAVLNLTAILRRIGKEADGDGDLQTIPYGT